MHTKTLAVALAAMVANGIRGVSSHLGASVARDPLLPRQDDVAPPPPLQQQRQQPPREAGNGQQVGAGGGSTFPWLTVAGFLYLTFSSVMALHRCWPNRGDAAFVVSAYADLLLLFYCLRRYERAEPGSSLREWLKLAVWLLTSALTLLFSYKVAAVMPAAVAAVVWVMGLATISGGFLAFFCFQTKTT